jgi:hypothetical protein
VYREVQYVAVGIEDVLGAVAVVNVPIEDGYPLGATRAGVLGGYSDVVQQAEAHPVAPTGVMTRRTGDGEGRRPGEGALDRPHGRPARQGRGIPGVRVEGRVEVNVASARRGEPFETVQVGGRVDRFEGRPRGGLALVVLYLHACPLGLFDAGQCRGEPLRGLHAGHMVDVALGGGVAVNAQPYLFGGLPRASMISSVISGTSRPASMTVRMPCSS